MISYIALGLVLKALYTRKQLSGIDHEIPGLMRTATAPYVLQLYAHPHCSSKRKEKRVV